MFGKTNHRGNVRGMLGLPDRRRLLAAAAAYRRDLGYQIGLIGFCQFTNVLRLAHYAPDVHPRYFGRLLLLIATSVASSPLRLWECLRFGRRIARTEIALAPVFIVGHWRSGTTHLHNLMSQDPGFGTFSMYQALVPNCTLVGGVWLKALLARLVPLKRPMDEMVWPMDAPQEEEIGLAKIMPYSFYARALFPRKEQFLFAKHILLQGASPAVSAAFRRHYRRLLQVATLHAQGRRLLLKNPVNTARICQLLELFPDAKFIHIHRSPYEVFASTRHLNRRILPLTTLQRSDDGNATESILSLYTAMMRQYLDERSAIPRGNLVEVRYDDLERDPLGELRRIYTALAVPQLEEAALRMAAYVEGQGSYRKNRLDLSADHKRQIEERWAFAFRAFGYASTSSDDSV